MSVRAWEDQVRYDCLIEAGGDIVLAQQAAEYILMAQSEPPDDGWVEVPSTFLHSTPIKRSAALAVSPSYPPEVIVHVAAPIVNVPQQAAPIVNVAAPVVNVRVPKQEPARVEVTVPKQETPTVKVEVPKQEAPVVNVNVPPQEAPTVNIAAPVINVAAPNVNVEAPAAPQPPRAKRKFSLKKDASGNWTGEVEEVS